MDFLREFISIFQENIVINKILRVLIILFITFIVKSIVNLIFNKKIKTRIEKNNLSGKVNTVTSVAKSFIDVVIYFIAITQVLNVFNVNTSSILAVAGIGGMAIAFAAQTIIEDVFSGAFILIENQFNVGDYITVNSIGGTVKHIGLRVIKLIDIDGKEIIIPNGEIRTVINHSVNQSRAAVNVYISDDSEYEKIEKLLKIACQKTFEKSKNFIEVPEVIGIQEFYEFGYSILIETFTYNGKQFEAKRELRKEILNVFNENNINISNLRKKNAI